MYARSLLAAVAAAAATVAKTAKAATVAAWLIKTEMKCWHETNDSRSKNMVLKFLG